MTMPIHGNIIEIDYDLYSKFLSWLFQHDPYNADSMATRNKLLNMATTPAVWYYQDEEGVLINARDDSMHEIHLCKQDECLDLEASRCTILELALFMAETISRELYLQSEYKYPIHYIFWCIFFNIDVDAFEARAYGEDGSGGLFLLHDIPARFESIYDMSYPQQMYAWENEYLYMQEY